MSRGGYCSKPSLGGSRILLSAPSLPTLRLRLNYPPPPRPLENPCSYLGLSLSSAFTRSGEKGGEKKGFPRKANRVRTRFADLFKRASLKRTRFTFMAVRSFREREEEEEEEEEGRGREGTETRLERKLLISIPPIGNFQFSIDF